MVPGGGGKKSGGPSKIFVEGAVIAGSPATMTLNGLDRTDKLLQLLLRWFAACGHSTVVTFLRFLDSVVGVGVTSAVGYPINRPPLTKGPPTIATVVFSGGAHTHALGASARLNWPQLRGPVVRPAAGHRFSCRQRENWYEPMRDLSHPSTPKKTQVHARNVGGVQAHCGGGDLAVGCGRFPCVASQTAKETPGGLHWADLRCAVLACSHEIFRGKLHGRWYRMHLVAIGQLDNFRLGGTLLPIFSHFIFYSPILLA